MHIVYYMCTEDRTRRPRHHYNVHRRLTAHEFTTVRGIILPPTGKLYNKPFKLIPNNVK